MRVTPILFVLFSACLMVPGQQQVVGTRSESVSAEGLRMIRVDVEAGNLEIVGTEERRDIELEAEFLARGSGAEGEGQIPEGLVFTHDVKGDVLEVEARTESRNWASQGSINVRIFAPSSLGLDVKDSSGDLIIRNMYGGLKLEDSSGDIELLGLSGPMTIDDSSGDIELSEQEGMLDVSDTSGDLDVRGVLGDVMVNDSSGDIDLRNVQGNVTVSDSSGDITVSDIEGDFQVVRDSSGRISYEGVSGNVQIPKKD